MIKTKFIQAAGITISISFFLLLSGCSQSNFSFFATPTFTPTLTLTPTATVTATITPTSTPEPTLTPSPIPLPTNANCENNAPHVASWSAKGNNGTLYDAFICPDDTLVAIFRNQNIPEKITINQAPQNKLEYEWSVYVDVDANKNTGGREYYSNGEAVIGAEYNLSTTYFSQGGAKSTVPFGDNTLLGENGLQTNTWEAVPDGWKTYEDALLIFDTKVGLIVLVGKIPAINANSQLLFVRYTLMMTLI